MASVKTVYHKKKKKEKTNPQTIDDKRANHKELQLYAGGCLTQQSLMGCGS